MDWRARISEAEVGMSCIRANQIYRYKTSSRGAAQLSPGRKSGPNRTRLRAERHRNSVPADSILKSENASRRALPAKLTAPNALLGASADQHRFVVHGRSMLVDCGRCLSAAIAVFSLKLQRAHAMIAVDALENAAVLDTCVGVMSHSCYCSPLFGSFRGTMVTSGLRHSLLGAAVDSRRKKRKY
jgi:hypothetical protein